MKRTTLMAAAGGAVVVLAATGTALGAAVGDAATPRSARTTSLVADTSTPSSSPSGTVLARGRISAEQAGRIALARAGGGRITEIEAEFEHGRPVWKVELVNGGTKFEVYVDRDTGAVVKAEREAVEARHGGDARHGTGKHSGGTAGTGSDDRSGHGSGSGAADRSGRDHPEDDATADDHGGDRSGRDGHDGDDRSGRDHPEDD
ncbi:MAG: PepSY domain-containing protein [Micromonosporaceae bacterium]|nr:PepSY domain-containing protein [Micromonosporaceae bacterium]